MKIGAVIVLYNPNYDVLVRGINALVSQVERVVLVDNSSTSNSYYFENNESIVYIPMFSNVGIAQAQNIGVDYLEQNSFDFVLFSDQDSCADVKIVEMLCSAFVALQENGYSPGAVGTRAVNYNSGEKYGLSENNISKIDTSLFYKISPVTEVYHLMSSISLFPLSVLKEVGYYNSNLFIDGVDYDICWRIKSLGYRHFIIENARIFHQLGEGDYCLFGRKMSIPSPFRCYYQYRNFVFFCTKKYVPSWWKKKYCMKYLVRYILLPLVKSPRIKYLKYSTAGLFDGIKYVFLN